MTEPRSHRQVRNAKQRMFEERGTVCHLCGHPGATEADHVIPLSVRPDLRADSNNLRPAHGGKRQLGPGGVYIDARCQTCLAEGKPGTCNQTRGAKPIGGFPGQQPVVRVRAPERPVVGGYERVLD